jgi:hypothetical protein
LAIAHLRLGARMFVELPDHIRLVPVINYHVQKKVSKSMSQSLFFSETGL